MHHRSATQPLARAPLPLAYRLPNPPPVYVGRRKESTELGALVKRAPVTMVCGIGGLGKTSLVLATLRRRYPAQVERTVMLDLMHIIRIEPLPVPSPSQGNGHGGA